MVILDLNGMTKAEAAEFYAEEFDFSVVPLRPDKHCFVDWKEFQCRRASLDEIAAWWQHWPDANVGIITGEISGIVVVDIDGDIAMEWVREHLPAPAVYSVTSRGWHAIYRHPGVHVANRVNIGPKVDVRGDGGYFVAPPSVHETGHVYRWEETQGLGGWDDLEPFPAHLLATDTHRDAPVRSSVGDIITRWSASCAFVAHYAEHQSEQSELAWYALISNAARMRECPVDLCHALSKDHPKYKKRDTDAKILHAMNDALGAHTCRFIHEQVGFTCGPCAGAKSPLQAYDLMDVAPLVAKAVEPAFEPAQEPAEDRHVSPAMRPHGVLAEIMDYIDRSTPVSLPLWNLGAAVALLGAVAGQKVQTETGLRTNLYVMSVGHSGTGKSSGMGTIPRILRQTKAAGIIGATTFTSDSAILKSLRTKPVQILCVDEIGDMFARMKNPQHPSAAIGTMLKDLFSRVNDGYEKTYASGDDLVVPWHHLSLIGAATPNRFWQGFSIDDALDGLLGRVLPLHSDLGAPEKRRKLDMAVPSSIVDTINAVFDIESRAMPGQNMGPRNPFIIPFTDDARDLTIEIDEHYRGLMNECRMDEDGRAPIYQRVYEHVCKLALIHAVSRHGGAVIRAEVDIVDVAWASAFVSHVIDTMVEQVSMHLSRGRLDGAIRKIVDFIRRTGTPERPGATIREINRGARVGDAKTVNEAVKLAVDIGELVSFPSSGRGPKTMLYGVANE